MNNVRLEPNVTPKFGMVDFDGTEINTFVALFMNIEVFIYNFHHEQASTRWTNNLKTSLSHIADVKCLLHRTTHVNSREELDKLIEYFF